ncbi:MAG: fenitrothion hydrolase, partial [Actinomycetota bacterium]|nr:fenitrothion hydrolase [Actinomycetota bacterium]
EPGQAGGDTMMRPLRRWMVVAATGAVAWLAGTAPASAHGIAVRGDLPLPLWLVAYGAAAVLVVSFVALGVLWPKPRLEDGVEGLLLPQLLDRSSQAVGWVLRVVGLGVFAVVWGAALFGPLSVPQNLAPYAVFIVFWSGGLIVSGLLGDLWSVASPFETIALLGRNEMQETSPVLERLGVWPAAVLLLAFAWFELVHPAPAEPGTLGIAIAVYVAIMTIGAAWFGRAWIRGAEAFGVTFRIVAAMAPLHRDEQGRLRLRPPLSGLADLPVVPGTAAVVLVALGSTTFDGVTRLPAWESLIGGRAGWAAAPLGTLGLVLTVAAVSGIYWWAMREAAVRTGAATLDLLNGFIHSLVPIALAYAIAHYFSLLVFEGQRFLALASDPFGRGWDLFGTSDWSIDYNALSVGAIAWVQAGAIVLGHVAGVTLAHDRAVARFSGKLAMRSQYALVAAMVLYTIGGLVLLLGG